MKVLRDQINVKEGTTCLATLSFDTSLKLLLYIIARGKSKKCEEKYDPGIGNDDVLDHTLNGWTTADLNWISDKMNKHPIALLLDTYRAYRHPKVYEAAKKHSIDFHTILWHRPVSAVRPFHIRRSKKQASLFRLSN